jgi:hypothetical protein
MEGVMINDETLDDYLTYMTNDTNNYAAPNDL